MKNSNKKKRLEQVAYDGITLVEPMRDKYGFYIPYCKLNFHPGIIDAGRAEMCEQRKCRHYKKLYV